MSSSNRRYFLGILGTSLAAFPKWGPFRGEEGPPGTGGSSSPQPPSPKEPLVEALRALNELGGLGIQPEDLDSAKDYCAGVYRDLPSADRCARRPTRSPGSIQC
jgi:hypothetical protein